MPYYNSRRQYLVSVFEDTIAKINMTTVLQTAVKNSIHSQWFIAANETINLLEPRYDIPAIIDVTANRTFEAAAAYQGQGKIAVLNFASASNPGGGVETGASAQEECLCRVSTLYPCLKDKAIWQTFYTPHRNAHNPLHDDDIIYTKDVVVIKDDDYHDLDKSFKVDVITCAAPNLRVQPSNDYNPCDGDISINISDEELIHLHEQRGRKILSVAAQNNVDILILGAFGCGAFRNNPMLVAQAYKNILPVYMNYFKSIEFAVYCSPKDDTNYRVFRKIIK